MTSILVIAAMVSRRITEAQWENLKENTFATAYAILQSVMILVDRTLSPSYGRDNSPKICTALYTHAIEEYGKLLYLKSLPVTSGYVHIDMRRFRDHKFKFQLALDDLPSKCTLVHQGSFTAESFTRSFSRDTITEWETRLTLFNTDIDSQGNVPDHPIIDLNMLQQAVYEFRTVLLGLRY